MNLAKVIAVSVLSGASIAYAATQMVTFKGTSEFTAKVVGENGEGLDIVKTETRFYDQHVFSMKGNSYERVFKVVERESTSTLTDGESALSYVEAYETRKSPLDTKVWTLKSRGGGFEIVNDDFVQVSEQGCCDSPTLNHLINSKTGKQIVVALNSSITEFKIPNSDLPSRYLAQIDENNVPLKRGNRTYIGSFGYFTNHQISGIARLYAEEEQGVGSDLASFEIIKNAKDETQSMGNNSGSTVNLWSADGSKNAQAAYSGIGLSGTAFVGKGTQPAFSIVIDHDHLSEQLSKTDPKLAIEFVKTN